MRVTFSENPIDCERACTQGISEFCKSFDATQQSGSQLVHFQQSLGRGIETGSIQMDEVHRIFQIAEGADPCDRSQVSLSATTLTNSGPRECELESSIKVGQRTLPVKVIVPAIVEGTLGVLNGDHVSSIHFETPAKGLTLILGDPDLQRRWGGEIRRIQADANSLLVSTKHSCLRIGTGSQLQASASQ